MTPPTEGAPSAALVDAWIDESTYVGADGAYSIITREAAIGDAQWWIEAIAGMLEVEATVLENVDDGVGPEYQRAQCLRIASRYLRQRREP